MSAIVANGFWVLYWRDVVSIGGTILSLLGIAITVLQTMRAKNAAEAARLAAESARSKILNVDLLFEMTRISGFIDELHGTVGQRAWALVVERSNRICDSIHSVNLQAANIMPEELRGELARVSMQLRTLASVADKASITSGSDPDVRKYRKILTDQKAPVLSAMEYLRSSART